MHAWIALEEVSLKITSFIQTQFFFDIVCHMVVYLFFHLSILFAKIETFFGSW